MEPQVPHPRINPTQLSKYSKRVILKTILGRADGGSSLVGERVVVGGWVKSAKEVRKAPILPLPQSVHPEKAPHAKGVTCTEILQIPLPVFRSFLKAFGVDLAAQHGKAKLEGPVGEKLPPPPTTAFLRISDGSSTDSLLVVVESALAPPGQIMLSGTCILVEGVIQKPSSTAPGKHTVEVKAESILHLGTVDYERYPLSKKRVPLDTLRDWAHIRPRTTTVASITRVSNSLTHGVHTFFQNNGFLHLQVPIITATDSEGFSAKFLINKMVKEDSTKPLDDDARGVNLETVRASIKKKSTRLDELKRTDSNREALAAAIQDLKKTNELASQLEAKEKASNAKKAKSSSSVAAERSQFQEDDFFSCQAYLTVSGRLHLGSYACALGNVYSFGPRFKAENAPSTKYVAEMWKVEAEMAFAGVEEATNCAVDLLKYLCTWVLEHCPEDMRFLLKRSDKTTADRLESIIAADFEKISYTDAVDALRKVTEKKFECEVEWGAPLTEEHERFLVDEIYKRPVIVQSYPKEIKPFYVRLYDDGKTAAAFDVVVPKVGALIRGSQNEERLNVLSSRIEELGLPSEQYQWYMDLLRHGTVKHAGFSLVFDHMVLLATGMTDVHNVIPFPTSSGKLTH